MNTNIIFYQRPIHEFNTLTTPLSLIELGAFTKLIDYLILHQTLPNTDRKYFLLNIKKKPEKTALDFVINEFCFINDSGELESEISNNIISKSQNISSIRSVAGKKGAEKRTENIVKTTIQNLSNCQANNNRNNNNNNNINNNINNNTNKEQNTDIKNKAPTQINAETSGGLVISPATQICIQLKQNGLATVNPSHPKLQKAVELGATPEMFVNAYNELKQQHKTIKQPFPYLIAMVINQITEAQTIQTFSISPTTKTTQIISTRNRPKFTQQQKADIIARMSNLDITNREYLPVLLENGYTPELYENNDCSYTLLTIEQIQQKLQQITNHYQNENEKVIDLQHTENDLFSIAQK